MVQSQSNAFRIQKRLLVERELRNILSESTEEGRQIREELGKLLYKLVRDDYLKKAASGTDSTGAKWEKTKKGVPIMIDTERLIRSLEYTVTAAGTIEVGFSIFPPENDSDNGRLIAFRKRPAWPADGVPSEWVDKLARHLRQLLVAALNRRNYLRSQ